MQATMELSELDHLIEHLDTEISQLEINDSTQTASLLLCSGHCGGGWSWYWYC